MPVQSLDFKLFFTGFVNIKQIPSCVSYCRHDVE